MLLSRLATAAVLLPVFASALLLLPNFWWTLLLLPILLVASLEWAALAGFGRGGGWLFGCVAVSLAAALSLLPDPGAAEYWQLAAYWGAAVFWLILAPTWLATRVRIESRAVMACAGWLALVPAVLALASLQSTPAALLMLLGVVWIADSAAYLAGRRFGHRRLAPKISPGKTWEGVAGAVAAVTVYYALLYLTFAPQLPLVAGPVGALLFAVVLSLSIEGDLFESWIKRRAGAKDSGTLLPGHGGVLDRVDGLTASMPIAALWCHYSGACGAA